MHCAPKLREREWRGTTAVVAHGNTATQRRGYNNTYLLRSVLNQIIRQGKLVLTDQGRFGVAVPCGRPGA